MPQRIEIDDERKRQAWEIYARQPDKHLPEIRAFLGVSAGTFVRMRKRWGWPQRQVALNENALSKAAKDEGGVAGLAKAAAASVHDAARALAQATRAQIATLMDEQRTGRANDHDKTARRLASYAKTLAAARALVEQESSPLDDSEPHDNRPRRSLHELREELSRHLDRVIAEEEARGGDGLLV
ncbi:hypothetical protein [Microvirga arsenatis]|uniref:Uncharacterized protein n=1 Tax=Microvirga arsenatis TaxID=2692265 RepID=A0ABW9Z0Y6_9HYPH|nr:hypothetical protein [Microvirga arsenatis]NBJ11495.1 hypothetical protein [Microvirga arsenatis]NBJ26333.1 hypothetical protein [Microvirga arsenatis]